METDPRWTWHDAWILCAIGTAKPQPLSAVLNAADAMDHSLPNAPELAESIGRLRAAGLVEPQSEDDVADAEASLALTALGVAVAGDWKGSMTEWPSQALERLAAV